KMQSRLQTNRRCQKQEFKVNHKRKYIEKFTRVEGDEIRSKGQEFLVDIIRFEHVDRGMLYKIPLHPVGQDYKLNNMIAYTVSEAMITDVFSVRQEDIIEMVAEMMIWKHIKQVPVENAKV